MTGDGDIMTVTDGEKIVRLQTQMEGVQKTTDRTESKVDEILKVLGTTVTEAQLKAAIEVATTELKDEFNGKIRAARNFNWITHSASAALGAFIIAVAYFTVKILTKQ